MRFVLVAGTTETARIDGISAAAATPGLLRHTPAADAELVAYGRPVFAPTVPVSPTGCPTPALVTRAVRDLVGFDFVVAEAGLAARTAAPSVTLGRTRGEDIRDTEPVPDATTLHERAREFAAEVPDDRLVIAETIPGGTTTAMGVLRALGEPYDVSSSLPTNPLELKREVVDAALTASDLAAGDLAGQPIAAVRRMGDPTLAVSLGLVTGMLDRDGSVTLAGGTQMLTVAALARHAGIQAPLSVATTPFVSRDERADVTSAATALDVDLQVTDPGFGASDHVAMEQYRAGVAKEGVGMGGALRLADRAGIPMATVRDQVITRYEEVVTDGA